MRQNEGQDVTVVLGLLDDSQSPQSLGISGVAKRFCRNALVDDTGS